MLDFTVEGDRNRRESTNEPTTCFGIPLMEDQLVERDEYFTVELSTQDSSVILMPQNATIIIRDNDGKSSNFSKEMMNPFGYLLQLVSS